MDNSDPLDDDHKVFEALRRLDFLCGKFRGVRRTWSTLNPDEPEIGGEVTFQASWVLDGHYLQEGIPHEGNHPRYIAYWGYDVVAEVYRKWLFARYGSLGRGFPDPGAWVGTFEGESLVMFWEQQSVIPMGMRSVGLEQPHDRPQIFVYTPERDGSFTRTWHWLRRGKPIAESFPGYYKAAETLFVRD